MISRWIIQSGDSLWRKLGEEAAKTAVSTFVEEGIKASVELWKTRHMKELDIEFDERRKARKEESGSGVEETAKDGDSDEDSPTEEVDEDEDAEASQESQVYRSI